MATKIIYATVPPGIGDFVIIGDTNQAAKLYLVTHVTEDKRPMFSGRSGTSLTMLHNNIHVFSWSMSPLRSYRIRMIGGIPAIEMWDLKTAPRSLHRVARLLAIINNYYINKILPPKPQTGDQ